MRIVNISTFYASAIDAIYVGTDSLGYADTLERFEDALFGSDLLWSAALRRATGWSVADVIANADRLQAKWRAENFANRPASPQETIFEQARAHRTDVVVLQDVSFLDETTLRRLKSAGAVLAAQISCPMPPRERVAMLDVAFTSFPHYVERLRAMGVGRVEFVPLAFEPTVCQRVLGPAGQPMRHLDVAFVGGVGRDSHWRAGTDALEILAAALGEDRFFWWGYGLDRLGPHSPLRACYHGEAWGREVYDKYLRAKIVVNRHGEVAEGSGNNLRQVEATGCGACLVTDQPGVFADGDSCAVYRPPLADHPGTIVEVVRALLADDDRRRRIAAAGQGETLGRHIYANRMPLIADALEEAVRGKK